MDCDHTNLALTRWLHIGQRSASRLVLKIVSELWLRHTKDRRCRNWASAERGGCPRRAAFIQACTVQCTCSYSTDWINEASFLFYLGSRSYDSYECFVIGADSFHGMVKLLSEKSWTVLNQFYHNFQRLLEFSMEFFWYSLYNVIFRTHL